MMVHQIVTGVINDNDGLVGGKILAIIPTSPITVANVSISRVCVRIIKFLPLVHHHRHTTTPPCLLCYHLTLTLLLGIFVLSGSLITLSSQHPSRATLTCHLGCLGGSIRCPSLLPSVLDLQVLLNFLHDTLHKQHWHAAWLPRWECSWLPLPLVAHVICLTGVVDFHFRRPASLHFRWQCSVYLSK